MMKFKGNRSIEEIRKLSEEDGCWVSTEDYDNGSDFINVGFHRMEIGFCTIILNTFNGIFFVYDENKQKIATHLSEELKVNNKLVI